MVVAIEVEVAAWKMDHAPMPMVAFLFWLFFFAIKVLHFLLKALSLRPVLRSRPSCVSFYLAGIRIYRAVFQKMKKMHSFYRGSYWLDETALSFVISWWLVSHAPSNIGDCSEDLSEAEA